MYPSHLDDEGLGNDDALGATSSDWQAQAVQAGAGILSNVTQAITGVPAQPLAQPTVAALPAVNPSSYLPQVITQNPSRVLLIGGIIAAGVVGYMFLAKNGKGRPKRKSTRRRRR